MIPGGTAFEGMKVNSPDGLGRVAKVLNPDVVLVELTSREQIKNPSGEMVYPFAKFDLGELIAMEAPRPIPGSDEALAEKEKADPAAPPEAPVEPASEGAAA